MVKNIKLYFNKNLFKIFFLHFFRFFNAKNSKKMLKITTFLKNSVFGRFLGSLKTVKNDHFRSYDKKVIKMDRSEKSLIKKLKKRKNAVFGDF